MDLRAGLDVLRKIEVPYLTGIQTPDRPARNPVATPTEVYRLHLTLRLLMS